MADAGEGAMQIELRWRSWHGDEALVLDLPPGYEVTVYPPNDGPDIGTEGIARAFASPTCATDPPACGRCSSRIDSW